MVEPGTSLFLILPLTHFIPQVLIMQFLHLWQWAHNISLHPLRGLLEGQRESCLPLKCYCDNSDWRRKWQPTPVFLPGESHGQRSLAGYCPWGHRVGHGWLTNIVAIQKGNGALVWKIIQKVLIISNQRSHLYESSVFIFCILLHPKLHQPQ